MEDKIMCPLVERLITAVDCMENQGIKDEFVPSEYKQKEDWREVCKNCKWYNY